MSEPVKEFNEETGSLRISFKLERDNTDVILRATDERITKFLTEAGMHLEREAKYELENDPRRIDTGLLRNSITFALGGKPTAITEYKADRPPKTGEVGPDGEALRAGEIKSGSYQGVAPDDEEGFRSLHIGTNVEYSVYVHEGTRRMTANRFLKNAIEKNMQQLQQKMIEAFSGIEYSAR